MATRLIKTDRDYQEALERMDALMSAGPGTPEADELDLLVHLTEEYEEQLFPIPRPDPITAIRFRMEQEGLRPVDLVSYLGSKAKVSEILSGKRSLSLPMIRKLHAGLRIPAEVLLGDVGVRPSPAYQGVDWRTFPLGEMIRRRWFGDAVRTTRDLLNKADEILGPFLFPPATPELEAIRLRRSGGTEDTGVATALWAWEARVIALARQQPVQRTPAAAVDSRLIGEVARLSTLPSGPLVARDMLAQAGIRVVHERHLPRTRLDGAAIRCADGAVIVAVTLRYDRLDHFWFTLCHELAHVALHLHEDPSMVILDDLEDNKRNHAERKADQMALDAMVPKAEWAAFARRGEPRRSDVIAFARSLRLHPAIIAGRWHKETGNYRLFRDLLGSGRVRSVFSAGG